MVDSGLVLTLLMTASSLGIDTSKESAERVRAIVAAIETRHRQHRPVFIKYQLQEYKSARIEAKLELSQQPRGPKGAIPPTKAKTETKRYELALKGANMYLGSHNSFSPGKVQDPSGTPYVWIKNEKGYFDRLDNLYSASAKPIGMPMTPWDATGEIMFAQWIKDWIDDPKKSPEYSFAVRDEKAPGEPQLVVLECYHVSGAKLTLWLLPDLDFLLHKAVELRPDGSPQLTVESVAYKVIDGVGYPEKAIMTNYAGAAKGATPEISLRFQLAVESIDTKPESIPDSLFRLQVPNDKPLYDRDTQTSIVDPDAIQDHLDRMSPPPQPRIRKYRRHLIAVALTLAFCVSLLASYRWKWRAARR